VAPQLQIEHFVHGRFFHPYESRQDNASWEKYIVLHPAHRCGKAKLGVLQLRGASAKLLCRQSMRVATFLSTDTTTLANQFTSNGWAKSRYDITAIRVSARNTQTAANVISLYLGYVNSTQYYNDSCFLSKAGDHPCCAAVLRTSSVRH